MAFWRGSLALLGMQSLTRQVKDAAERRQRGQARGEFVDPLQSFGLLMQRAKLRLQRFERADAGEQ
jgi:hypothetical protein